MATKRQQLVMRQNQVEKRPTANDGYAVEQLKYDDPAADKAEVNNEWLAGERSTAAGKLWLHVSMKWPGKGQLWQQQKHQQRQQQQRQVQQCQ